jgi:hypothetical protein
MLPIAPWSTLLVLLAMTVMPTGTMGLLVFSAQVTARLLRGLPSLTVLPVPALAWRR